MNDSSLTTESPCATARPEEPTCPAVGPAAVETWAPPIPSERLLPSGRSVVVRCGNGDELLEIRAPDGCVEVQILLRDDGPLVRLAGARFELNAVESVALTAPRIVLSANEHIAMQAGGTVAIDARELRVRTIEDVNLVGEHIRLNCPEE